jgi:hypothetical protein
MSVSRDAPSYVEHDGYYNIPDECVDPMVRKRIRVHRSVEVVPPLGHAEFREVTEVVRRLIWGRANMLQAPIHAGDAHYCVGDELVDRTVEVQLPHFDMLSSDFVADSQTLLRDYPLWRIMVHGDSPDTTVLIYPNAIRVGGYPLDAPLDDSLRRTVARVLDARERRDGAQDRQRQLVQALLYRHKPTREPAGYRVVAVFDNYKGDSNQSTVWLLCPGEYEQRVRITNGATPVIGAEVEVLDDGTMLDDVDPVAIPPFALLQSVIPSESLTSPLILTSKAGGAFGKVLIDRASVLSDEDVKVELRKLQAE